MLKYFEKKLDLCCPFVQRSGSTSSATPGTEESFILINVVFTLQASLNQLGKIMLRAKYLTTPFKLTF